MRQIKNNIYWVGQADWDIKHFHGQEYSTHRGSSYNSYLVREEKTALIDTVWGPFAHSFVDQLEQSIDLKDIDLVVANHAETDHSGALPELMRRLPAGTPLYCSRAGVSSLKGHYHEDWNFQPVKTGDKVNLGNGKELVFIEAPLLHWPDSMFTYLRGEAVLFSNDAFGQHYASEFLFDDQVSRDELIAESIKYYANILTPFSSLVQKKIDQFLSLGWPLEMICPSHGVIWRQGAGDIVKHYQEWAADYATDQVTVIYDTMWNATKEMAEAMADGIRESCPGFEVKLFNVSLHDKNDVITEIFKSRAVLAGSSTINRGILSAMAGLLEMAKGLGFKGKQAAAFGSYGWTGEAAGQIEKTLTEAGFEIIAPSLRVMWQPDQAKKATCVEYGREFGKKLVAGR